MSIEDDLYVFISSGVFQEIIGSPPYKPIYCRQVYKNLRDAKKRFTRLKINLCSQGI